jgi:tetratricopeptide (TPR) repeat protein
MIHAQGWTANDGSYPLEERAEGWQPSWKVRLFPNDRRFRFRGDVHEMVEASLREAGLPIERATFVIHHYGELDQDPLKQLDKKLRYFEVGLQKLAQQPDDLAAVCELAVQAGELGRFEKGIELWDRVLRQHSDYVEALFNKGYCLMGLQQYDEALECSRRALELAPDHKEAAFNYGTCELYVGDPQRALAVIRPVAAQHPGYPLLKSLLAVLCLATDNITAGQKLVQELLTDGYGINGYIQERTAVLTTLHRSGLADRIMHNRSVGQRSV